jgi:hypothetical protein
VNPAQEQALYQLGETRRRYFEEFPNRWIAVNGNGTVQFATDFEQLLKAPGVDAETCVFAFVADGAWA